MTLLELQEILGERVRMTVNASSMDEETWKREEEASDTIARLAKQMINSADVILRREKARADGKHLGESIDKVIG